MTFNERELKKALEKAAAPKIKKIVSEINKEFERLSKTHKGRTPSSIKLKLKALFKRKGLEPNAKTLNEYAEAISRGEKSRYVTRS